MVVATSPATQHTTPQLAASLRFKSPDTEMGYLKYAWSSRSPVILTTIAVVVVLFFAGALTRMQGDTDSTMIVLSIVTMLVPAVVLAVVALLLHMQQRPANALYTAWSYVAAICVTLGLAGYQLTTAYCVSNVTGANVALPCETMKAGYVPLVPVTVALLVPHLVAGMEIHWVHVVIGAVVVSVTVVACLGPHVRQTAATIMVTIACFINIVALAYYSRDRELHSRQTYNRQVREAASASPHTRSRKKRLIEHDMVDAMNHSQHMFIRADMEGVLQYASSRGAKQLLGMEAEDLEGRANTDTIAPEDKGRFKDQFDAALETPNVPFIAEYKRVMQSGEKRLVHFSGMYVCDKRGSKATCLIGFESDITDATKRLHMANSSKCAHCGSERVGAGAGSESTTRSSAATKTNDAITHYSSNELRNSLHAMDATVGMLGDMGLDGVDEDLSDLRSASKNIQLLVDNLLVLTRLREGTLLTQPDEVKLEHMLATCVNGQRSLLRPGVELTLDIDRAVPASVCLDAKHLMLLLTNGLASSVRHTEAGMITVHVSLETDSKDKLRFEVVDHGDSLNGATMETLMTSLEKGLNVSGTRARRSALLLPLCTQLAAALLGRVAIEQVGKMLRYTVVVPFTRTSDTSTVAASGAGTAVESENPVPEVAGMYVMLVDDMRLIRRQGANMLERLGCTYHLLEDGDMVEQALKDATRPFDCILMDIVMSRTDGAVVCKRLRDAQAGMPIVAMTSRNETVDVDRFLKMGFDMVLAKPFNVEQLGNALLKSTQMRAGWRFRKQSAFDPHTMKQKKLDAAKRLDEEARHAYLSTTPEEVKAADGDVPDMM